VSSVGGVKTIGLTAALVSVILLFVGGPSANASRSYQEAWNFGHILAFGLWTFLALRLVPALQRGSCRRRWLLLLAAGVALGCGSEGLQAFTGRSADLHDVFKDLLGVTAALAFFEPTLSRHPRRWLLRGVAVAALLWTALPAVRFAIDEAAAYRQFPLLADFEQPLERRRWIGHSRRSLSTEQAWTGEHSLRVTFLPGHYSGLTLEYFPHDWRGQRLLEFHLYNPAPTPRTLYVQIYDGRHLRDGAAYGDRFNQTLKLAPGWNPVQIPLDRVRTAPHGRELEMNDVRGFRLFSAGLQQPQLFYLDSVRLVP